MKARISIRSLLVFTACFAFVCFWRDRPRQIANRFVRAIEAGQYRRAESMFTCHYDVLSSDPLPARDWYVDPIKQSTIDWIVGRYYVAMSSKRDEWDLVRIVQVSAWGIEPASDFRTISGDNARP